MALHVLHACVKPNEPAQLLFASRHGELARSAHLLGQLAAQEVPSPMGFSLSVLNAAVGLYGIARGNRAASSAISAGEATFPMALLEAACQACTAPQAAVVVVFADEPPPAVYAELVDSPKAPLALAVRMESGAPATNMEWEPSSADGDAEAGPSAFLRCMEEGVPSTWRGGGYAWRWSPHAAA